MVDPRRPPGTSEALRDFSERLQRAAESDVTVLIEGESGAGKSTAARRLHALSGRAAGPLVEVPLAALSATLLEAELFGHEEGAYTGAHRARVGRFQRAEGGTLVLESVEDLPEELQVKLLRALQERVVEPLGGEREMPIDVRVVATCREDLAKRVEAGEFREDLYYRLAVVPLRVPPLRTRLADLPELVTSLVETVAERTRTRPRAFPEDAMECLSAHSWPGNVRELENAIERVLVLAEEPGSPVSPDELAFLGESVDGTAERVAAEALAAGLDLDDLQRAFLARALKEQRGNVSAAARSVGLSRRAFEYRMSKLGAPEGTEDEKAET